MALLIPVVPPFSQFDIFTSSGTWTKAPWARTVDIIFCGGGGGGGSGRRALTATAGSGGLGGWACSPLTLRGIDVSTLGGTETVTIGAKGTGGAAQTGDSTDGNAGTFGGNTTFGSKFIGPGGPGGAGGTATAVAAVSGLVNNSGFLASTASSITAALSTVVTAMAGGTGGSITTGGAALSGANSGPPGVNFLLTDWPDVGAAFGATETQGADATWAFDPLATPLLIRTYGTPVSFLGLGGGGGGAGLAAAAGRGGNAAGYGSGGGGGGASRNGFNSGKGGDGTPGICIVIQRG